MSAAFDALWSASMSDRGFFRIGHHQDAGTVRPVGVDLGGRVTVIGATNVAGLGVTLTVHVEGGMHWAGRGTRAPHGAQMITWLVARKDADTWRYIRLAQADLPRNATERSAKTDKLVAEVLLTMTLQPTDTTV